MAYGALSPHGLGGGMIDLYNTPGYRRGMGPDYLDGTQVAVLYRKVREPWVVAPLDWSD